jgi:hypothetical protein
MGDDGRKMMKHRKNFPVSLKDPLQMTFVSRVFAVRLPVIAVHVS